MTAIAYTKEQLDAIFSEAEQAATEAARKFFHDRLGGKDQYACGFAWVDIYGIKGNTKLGKLLDKVDGVRRDSYNKCYRMWNPSGLGVQNVDTLEAGAEAAAKVFKKYGFEAYAGSRLD